MPQVQLSQEPALALDVQVPSPISRLNRFHRGKHIHNPLRFYIFTSSSIIIMMQNQKKKKQTPNPKPTKPSPLHLVYICKATALRNRVCMSWARNQEIYHVPLQVFMNLTHIKWWPDAHLSPWKWLQDCKNLSPSDSKWHFLSWEEIEKLSFWGAVLTIAPWGMKTGAMLVFRKRVFALSLKILILHLATLL